MNITNINAEKINPIFCFWFIHIFNRMFFKARFLLTSQVGQTDGQDDLIVSLCFAGITKIPVFHVILSINTSNSKKYYFNL